MPRLYEYRDNMIYCHHSYDETPDPDQFSMHAHEKMEILYFITVQGTFLVEGNPYELRPGDLFLMRYAETHKLIIDPSTPYERIAIHFTPKLILALGLGQDLLLPFLDRPLGQFNRYDRTSFPTDQWLSAFQEFTFTSSAVEHAHLIARLLTLLSELRDAFDHIDGQSSNSENRLSIRLVRYINEHLFEDISLQVLSEQFQRSQSQINRLFRQAVGTSLWEYVMVKRLLAARAMIRQGAAAGKACDHCGFNDYSSFFRAYKQRFGCAPSSEKGIELLK